MLLSLSDVDRVITDHGDTARAEWRRLAKLDALVEGKHDKPRFENNEEERRYAKLWEASTINLVGQAVNAYRQRLAVDGFRSDERDEQPMSTPWQIWTRSGMPARQKRLFGSALTHGYSFLHVGATDAEPGAVLTPTTGRRVWCHYADEDDDWPEFALQATKAKDRLGTETPVWKVWDDEQIWTVPTDTVGAVMRSFITVEPHNTGVVPFSRLEADWGASRAKGLVDPLIGLNDMINRITFVLNLIGENSSFALRFMTGVEAPKDPETGKPVKPTIGPDRLMQILDPQGKMGQLDPSDPTGLIGYWEKLTTKFFSLAQLPSTYLLGEMANLSAEALVAAEATFAYALDDACRTFGLGIDRGLRLSAAIAKDELAASDGGSRVVWAPVQAKSLAAEVDGWGKAVQMLQVPAVATWSRLPGVTRQDVEEWKRLKEQETAADPMSQLQRLMDGNGRDVE